MNKKEVLTSINGNMNRFLTNVESAFKDKEFDSTEQLQKELEKYLSDNIFKYVYFESVLIEKEDGEANESAK